MPAYLNFSNGKTALKTLFLSTCLLLLFGLTTYAQTDNDTADQLPTSASTKELKFTGEVLPVFYVRDVLASVSFYVDKLGFVCDHYYDHINGGSVTKWEYDEPPLYAEMRAGNQKFALHRANNPDSLVVGGTRHYFSVADVRAHREYVVSKGVEAGELIERPWMDMFRVVDPDGHELFLFTRPPDWEE